MMLGGAFGWVKALSIGKKLALGSATVVTTAAIAAPSTPPTKPVTEGVQSSAQTAQEVEPVTETKRVTETKSVAFKKENINDSSMDKGTKEVRIFGIKGERTLVYEVTYVDGRETNRELISDKVTRKPVNQVTAVGTYVEPVSNCDPNYSPCVPNVSYDLDCPDIGFSVTVIGFDKHGFDGSDNDGYGCESY